MGPYLLNSTFFRILTRYGLRGSLVASDLTGSSDIGIFGSNTIRTGRSSGAASRGMLGVICQGFPLIWVTSTGSDASSGLSRCTSLVLTHASGVPMMYSSVLSMNPRRIPCGANFPSSYGFILAPPSMYWTFSPHLMSFRGKSFHPPLCLCQPVLPSAPFTVLVCSCPAYLTAQGSSWCLCFQSPF